MVAGGGVQPGIAYGRTDDFGHFAIEKKVHMHDMHATILHLLGIDHEKLTFKHAAAISGSPTSTDKSFGESFLRHSHRLQLSVLKDDAYSSRMQNTEVDELMGLVPPKNSVMGVVHVSRPMLHPNIYRRRILRSRETQLQANG